MALPIGDFFRPRLALSKTFRGKGRPTFKALCKDAPVLRFAALEISCPCYEDEDIGVL